MKEFIGLGTLPLFFLLLTSPCRCSADLWTFASISPRGTVQSFVITLSGSKSSTALEDAFAFRGARFAFALGERDLRLVSGFVLVSGDPNDLPLLVLMTLSYPVVGGVAGGLVRWKPYKSGQRTPRNKCFLHLCLQAVMDSTYEVQLSDTPMDLHIGPS